MSIQNGCVLTHEGIGYLCGLIRDINGLDTNLIDDLNIKSNGTFSSVRINTLLNALKTDCNDFANSLVSNISKLELKIVTDESSIVDSNILYLYKPPTGQNSYNQYVVIEGNKVLLGTTDINISDYYTITQADTKFTLKTDFDALKTGVTNLKTKVGTDTLNTTSQDLSGGVNELKTDLTTHTNDTDIHVTTAERTKWNEVDNKVDKTSILTAINASPSDSNLLSEKAIKSELDKKSNNTDLDNFKQGTLVTQTSMNKNILLWDVGHYYFNMNYTWQAYEHRPNTSYAPHVYVTSVKPTKYKDINLDDTDTNAKSWFRQIKVEDHLGSSFIRTIYTPNVKDVVDLENGKLLSSGSDTGWQRVSTSIADVGTWTYATLTYTDTAKTDTPGGSVSYRIKNGICFVRCTVGENITGKNVIKVSGMPPIDGSVNVLLDNDGACVGSVWGYNGTELLIHKTNSKIGYATFSYLVLES